MSTRVSVGLARDSHGRQAECMSEQHKADLRQYLQDGREAIVWKLAGL